LSQRNSSEEQAIADLATKVLNNQHANDNDNLSGSSDDNSDGI
jgi:hypothetical protein